MNKYRVLKPYPKQITNSGRLVTLNQGKKVYLKKEPQVLRLVKLGFLKPVVELPKKKAKPKKRKEQPKKVESSEKPKEEVKIEDKEPQQEKSSNRRNKSEYLNKKNKGRSGNSNSN